LDGIHNLLLRCFTPTIFVLVGIASFGLGLGLSISLLLLLSGLLHFELGVLDPLLELAFHHLDVLRVWLVLLILDDSEHSSWVVFRSPDLEEWIRMGHGSLTLLTEIEVLGDRAFVEVPNNGGDSTVVTLVTLVNWEIRLLSHLNSLHFWELVRDMSLIDVQNLGDLKCQLWNS